MPDDELLYANRDRETVWVMGRRGLMVLKWQGHVPTMTFQVQTEAPSQPQVPQQTFTGSLGRSPGGGWAGLVSWDGYYRLVANAHQQIGKPWWQAPDKAFYRALATDLSGGPKWTPYDLESPVEHRFALLLEGIYQERAAAGVERSCGKCGRAQKFDALFCHQCGTAVVSGG